MRKALHAILFCIIFLVLVEVLGLILLPGNNIKKYGSYNVSAYEILGEDENTIDVVAVGDSLVYSSLSPMEIWNEYGYTVFDCALAAQVIPDTYKYLKVALESQHPKIVFMESNVLFRDPNKQKYVKVAIREFKKLIPIVQYHNNWKKYLNIGLKENWINIDKGYKYNAKIAGTSNENYMKYSKKEKVIPNESNLEYFDKIAKITEEYGAKLVLISFPSKKTWTYKKHNTVANIAKKYNIEYLDLNLEIKDIDWLKDTKDKGDHLNNNGAKKVSKYIGKYLKNTGLVESHKGEEKYKSWDSAYSQYLNHIFDK